MIISSPTTTLEAYKPQQGDDQPVDKKKAQLKAACQDFEAVMTSLIMKEGLKSAKEMGKISGDNDDESDKGCTMFKDIANEQIAHYIGRQGLMGIADLLYNQVASRLDKIKQPGS